jgi:hypothetical protein
MLDCGTMGWRVRLSGVPLFQITVVNHDFEATSEQELGDMEEARISGLKSALEIGRDQLVEGSPLFGAEVIVTDGTLRERFILSMGTSPLK